VTSPLLAVDGQVLQRSGATGTLRVTRPATIRVGANDGSCVVDWVRVEDELDVPVGGPYRVEERSPDGAVVPLLGELFVGDLFLLGGQSNMLGCGLLQDLEAAGELVRLFGMDQRWQLAVEPLHREWRSPDPVHNHPWGNHDLDQLDADVAATMGTAQPSQGAGCGIAFANEYVRLTGIPVGILPVARGGTSLGDWAPDNPGTVGGWTSATPHEPGTSLFSSMVRMAQAAGGRVAGLLWHQGESDANPVSAGGYVEGTRAVLDGLRKELCQPDLPVYVAQMSFFPINRDPLAPDAWTQVRLAQTDPEPLGAQGMAATVDLTLSDPIHLDTASQQRLGRRFAKLASNHSATLRLAEVTTKGRMADWPVEGLQTLTVRLRFSGVTGRLVATHPSGFSLRSEDGMLVPAVWRIDLDGDCVLVHLAGPEVEGAALYYGYGVVGEVVCTIADEADMALPALGPIALPVIG